MKKVKFLFLTAFAAVFAGCQSEEMLEKSSENDKTTPTGDIRITIEGEGMTNPATRATDGRVEFEGGYATGAGLYNGTDQPVVEAHPDGGYEVSYFYGGPTNEPKKYDYSQSGTSLFEVDLGGQDHTFHCGFKEKKRNLTVNAGTGGSVSPSGTNSYRVKKPIDITATPDNGYEFTGWTITEGDVTIKDPSSLTTTATLHNTNSTITAEFEPVISISNFIIVGNNGIIFSKGQRYIVGSVDWKNMTYTNGKYVVVGGNGYISSSTDGVNWTTPKQLGSNTWNAVTYGNGKFVVIGNNGYISSSVDGVNWTTPLKRITLATRSITYGDGKFIAVGEEGYIAYSNDGENWFTKYRAGEDWNAVIYANGKFVAVGAHCFAALSLNGELWQESYDCRINGASDIIYANGKYVVVGNKGFTNTSTNGSVWEQKVYAGNINWKGVAYADGKYVAVGSSGYITSSNDGVSWTTPKLITDESGNPITATLNSICIMP